jgi:hypothetical protein
MLWTMERHPCSKYICPLLVLDWNKSSRKSHQNTSIFWKALVQYFSLTRKWITWKVGDGKIIMLGVDPYIGGGGN